MNIFFHYSLSRYANTYLVAPGDHGDAILIDPGYIDLDLIERIENNHFTIAHVLLTHRHTSHTEGLGTLLKIYHPHIYAGTATAYDFQVEEIQDRSHLDLSGVTVEALQIPGHTIDSFVYRMGNALFTGDVLLAGRIGSTQGVVERALLLKGITKRLFTLDERLIIFPGHGTLTTIKIEKMFNHEIIDALADKHFNRFDQWPSSQRS